MKYKFTGNLAFETPDNKGAAEFYQNKLGIPTANLDADSIHVAAGPLHIYFDRQPKMNGPVFELMVEDLDEAKADLLNSGCSIVRWEGKGRPCYVKDPFGFVFNVYEDKSAFL